MAGPPADRFLVALAVLTLLAEVASAVPLLGVVDDVQWLDPESAVVLGFVARRLYAERVVLFAVREPAGELPALAGMPELTVGGLNEAAALELLASLTPGRMSPAVAARIVTETGGNPLALVDARRVAAAVAREPTAAGRGGQSISVPYCLAILELGLGNYQAALRDALGVFQDDAPFLGAVVLPDLVEAAARCGETGIAEDALGLLAERALAAGTPLALGLLARSRALLAADADAEPLYTEAIGHLGQCRARPQLARAYLVYGEWLRRQRRRRDAREQLRIAHEMFTAMSVEAFAERARIELLATGERARQRSAGTETELTAQEAQIARLVSQGDSNRDIAAQLFLSTSTVDYHLRKVFRKTGVTSRTQLARAMAADGP